MKTSKLLIPCLAICFIFTLSIFYSPFIHAQVCDGDVTLSSQADVDVFNCTSVNGNLHINGDDIDDLSPLSGLQTVGGNMIISSCDILPNLNGLGTLSTIYGYLHIDGNPLLTNLMGLGSLSSIGSGFQVGFNERLTNLSGLSSLDVGWSLRIIENDMLTNLDGLSGAISTITDLEIYKNPVLTNINGLLGLTSYRSILIESNALLTNLDGLSNVTYVEAEFEIFTNAMLGSFCGLYNLISSDEYRGNLYVVGNLENPTDLEIIEGGPCATIGCDDFAVNLIDSNGLPISGEILEYREGGGTPWQMASEISAGLFCIETERTKVALRIHHGPQILKVSNVPTNTPYTFQTELVTLELKNALNLPVQGAEAAYTSGGWHIIGNTGIDGTVDIEMLPTVYTFRMKYNRKKENKREVISPVNNRITFYLDDLKSESIENEYQKSLAIYPNPFNETTTIAFEIETASEVTISVFDLTGKVVDEIYRGEIQAGIHKFRWESNSIKKGLYILRFENADRTEYKRIVKM